VLAALRRLLPAMMAMCMENPSL